MSLAEKVKNTTAHWGPLAKLYHWGIAALIFVQIPLGFYAHFTIEAMQAAQDFSDIDQVRTIFAIHKSTGIIIGLAMLPRLYWRLTTVRPPLSGELPHWWRFSALSVHWVLYVLTFAMVFSGYTLSDSTNFYLLFELPRGFEVSDGVKDVARGVHWFAAWSLTALVIFHTVAAIFHHFAMKDDTLVRMLPKILGGRATKD